MPKVVTEKQKRLMLSKNTPLSPPQKNRFLAELHEGTVRVKSKKRGKV
jgi:hypothetical protein